MQCPLRMKRIFIKKQRGFCLLIHNYLIRAENCELGHLYILQLSKAIEFIYH